MVCRFIPGVPLDRERLLAQDASTRQAILEQLGGFLCELHSVPVGASGATYHLSRRSPGMKEDYEELYQTLERELFPAMMAWARDWVRGLFRPLLEGKLDLSYAPATIHGDLMPYHLCYDPVAQRLSGVIDFGNAGPGDPALDLGSIIMGFGETLVWQMQTVYSGISELLDRARFHAASNTSFIAATTRSWSATLIAGKSGRLTMWLEMSSACGNWPSRKPKVSR